MTQLEIPTHVAFVGDGRGGLQVELASLSGLVVRLESWEDGLALLGRTGEAASFVECLRAPRLRLFENATLPPAGPLREFLGQIPSALRRMAARVRWRQLDALRLCRHHPAAVDLARSQPVLLWLVADWLAAHREVDPAWLLRHRRRELLAIMFGPCAGTEARVRLLAKLEAPTLTFPLVVRLRELLALEHIPSVLRHMPSITSAVVRAAAERRPELELAAVRHMLLHEKAGSRQLADVIDIVDDIREMADQFGIAHIDRRLHGCPNRRSLVGLHDEIALQRGHGRARELIRRFGDALPPAPLAGTKDIEPLQSITALAAEATFMEHCGLSLVRRIRTGESYMYRVFAPQRATLEVALGRGKPRLKQLKLRRNREPALETYAVVRRWLRAARAARAARQGSEGERHEERTQ